MKVLNRGKRKIDGHTIVKFTLDEAGERVYEKNALGKDILPVPFTMLPNTAIDFDDATGKHLRRLFPNELVTFEDLQRQFDGSTIVNANPPVINKIHMNEQPTAEEKAAAAVPSQSDLSDEELLIISKMRAERAMPVSDPAAEPVVAPVAPADEVVIPTPSASEKKAGFLDSVKSALGGGA